MHVPRATPSWPAEAGDTSGPRAGTSERHRDGETARRRATAAALRQVLRCPCRPRRCRSLASFDPHLY
jgi:hypothetical protein